MDNATHAELCLTRPCFFAVTTLLLTELRGFEACGLGNFLVRIPRTLSRKLQRPTSKTSAPQLKRDVLGLGDPGEKDSRPKNSYPRTAISASGFRRLCYKDLGFRDRAQGI